jgi:hypothetical protein
MPKQYLAVVTEEGGHTIVSPVLFPGTPPVDPGFGVGVVIPPHSDNELPGPPVTIWPPPAFVDNDLPEPPPGSPSQLPSEPPPVAGQLPVWPPHHPPGTVWPPLGDPDDDFPEGDHQLAVVWLPGVGFRVVVIEGKPIHEGPDAEPKR